VKRLLPVLAAHRVLRRIDEHVEIARQFAHRSPDHGFRFLLTAEVGETGGGDRLCLGDTRVLSPHNLATTKRFCRSSRR
jgi:hypothetical protein